MIGLNPKSSFKRIHYNAMALSEFGEAGKIRDQVLRVLEAGRIRKRKRKTEDALMKNEKNGLMVRAAMAGLIGVAVVSIPGVAHAKKDKKQMAEVAKCYDVNKCKGFSKCAGATNACAGKNACKGQGFVLMPKESCEAVGGSLTAAAAEMKK
jgi:uncharacterized membrane protein